MNTFGSIKELLKTLSREHNLFTEIFGKRKSLSFKYENALDLTDQDQARIQYLIDRSVIRQNGEFIEMDDLFLQFFEQILEVNEEINLSFINEHIEHVKQNILYYNNENNENRKYGYLRVIKRAFRSIGVVTMRNVIDLKRNIDTTFKSEPNYKIKKIKLEKFDEKRESIHNLIRLTENIIIGQEKDFFDTVNDEELDRIIIRLKITLNECRHNLIEIQKQIIDYLNQIKQQAISFEKIRQVKYLKDQFELESQTNIREILSGNMDVLFENRPSYPLKLSIDFLQNDDDVLDSIKKVFVRMQMGRNQLNQIAESIAPDYLDIQTEEETSIDLYQLKEKFKQTDSDLFSLLISEMEDNTMSFDECVTLYCQLISNFDQEMQITNSFAFNNDVEYAIVYPNIKDKEQNRI
ncbi:MAG: hypothetical protein ACRCXN_02380 [Bacteroidales bacterium]